MIMPKKPAKSQKGAPVVQKPTRTATKGPRTTEKEGEEQDVSFKVPRTPGYDEPEPAGVVVEEDRPQADSDDEEGGEEEATTSQSKRRKTSSTTEEVDYSEIAGEEEAPKKVGIKFSQRDELQIITS